MSQHTFRWNVTTFKCDLMGKLELKLLSCEWSLIAGGSEVDALPSLLFSKFLSMFWYASFLKKKSSSHFTPRSVSPAVWDMGEYALFGERGSLSFKCHIWKREAAQFTVTPWFHPRGQKYVYFLCQAVMIFGCCGIRQISPRGFPGFFFFAKVDTSCY